MEVQQSRAGIEAAQLEARLELEKLFPPKVYLELFVKVQPQWRNNSAVIAELDSLSETEDEKAGFIEATMPTGFKQMLTSFEQLPEEKRRKAIDDALRNLRQARDQLASGEGGVNQGGSNSQPVLSPELQAQVRTIGLKTLYSQSSAQTKAELAPVLEELQRVMESGRPFRGR